MTKTLRLGEIDKDLKVVKPQIFICRPDQTTIQKLSEAYAINLQTRLGSLDSITFRIPSFVERNHVEIQNKNIDLIKHGYLIKVVLGYATEFFLLGEIDKSASDSEEYVEYNAYGLGNELNDKGNRVYEATSKTMTEILTEILGTSVWSVGYVDSEFDLKYRSIEVTSRTTLEIIVEIANKFNALITWDTKNRKVNMFNPSNIGKNKGLTVDSKYLLSVDENQNAENIVTRLRLYGQEELSIRSLSPTGSNYIEDFSYFMYPFERDKNKKTVKHSAYMSEGLCHAILDYQDLVESKTGEFNSLLQEKKECEDKLLEKTAELTDLATELIMILDKLDIENANGVPNPSFHAQLITDRHNKESEIVNKESEITILQTENSNIDQKILSLQSVLNQANSFTGEQIRELNLYVREREFVNDSIIDEKDLLKEGIEAFKEMREPSIDVKIDMVNLLEIVECQNNWDKLNLGDTIVIRHDPLNTHVKAKIVEIDYDFDDSTIQVTIANARRFSSDNEFNEMIKNSHSSSVQVNMDKYKWDLSLENNGTINDIINNIWDATKRKIEAGSEQLIQISERGIIVRSPEEPMTYLVIQNGMLAITNDDGNTWKHAITSEGIVGERIFGKIIMGVNLAIEDIDGIIKFRGSKGQIFDRDGNEVMRLGLITEPPEPDCFGIKLENDRNQVFVSSCDGFKITRKKGGSWENVMYADLEGKFWVKDFTAQNLTAIDDDGYFRFEGNKGTVSDGQKVVMRLGYLDQESPRDFGIILENDINKIYMTRNRGFEITRNESGSWVTKFKADKDGGLYAEDITTKNLKIVDGELGEKIIFDHEEGITINGNNGEQIRLNANEGIAIDVEGDKRFWVGTDGNLYARKLIITPDNPEDLVELPDGSFISDLTVNSVRTLNSTDEQNYVYVKDNFLKLFTGQGDITDIEKFSLFLDVPAGQPEGFGFPSMIWGAGDEQQRNQGFLYKDREGFVYEISYTRGGMGGVYLNNRSGEDSILIDTPYKTKISAGQEIRLEVGSSSIVIDSSGVKINGTRIDLN